MSLGPRSSPVPSSCQTTESACRLNLPGLKFREQLAGEESGTLLRLLSRESAIADLHGQVEVAQLLATLVEAFEDLLRSSPERGEYALFEAWLSYGW